jgi:hypothetical protein
MAVSDDEFQTMRARARVYRMRIKELGPISGPVITESVRGCLDFRPPTVPLSEAQRELVDEIIAFLKDPRLDLFRARMLEQEFFNS